MRSLPTSAKSPIISLLRTSCLLLAWVFSSNARAILVNDLYEVVLPVADESSEVRNAAMADGLAEMLVRQSGDGDILQKLLPPPAGAYVKQYRYESRQPADPADASAKQIRLQYNSTRVMDFLREHGIAIWGDHRSLAVVWLAVRDGNNQYILRSGDVSLFKTQIDRLLKQRGVPAVWPAYDKKDIALIKFADIWAGFSEPLKQASARYTQGPVLAGNLAWNGSTWSSDWTLIDQRYSQRWSMRGKDYEQLLSDAINQVSNALGKQYAVLESSDSSAESQVTLEIENVKSLASFVRVKKYLASLQAVQNVQMKRVAGEYAVFSLALRSRVDDFINLLAASSQLRPVKPVTPSPGEPPLQQGPASGDPQQQANPAPVVASNLYHYRLVY